MEFLHRCAATAGVDLADPDVEVDQRGLQNLVLVNRSRGVVWRFPRTSARCATLADACARLQLLAGHDLPVPRVLEHRAGHLPGEGYLQLTYLPGAALDTLDTDRLRPGRRDRLVDSLIETTQRIHAVPVGNWPTPTPSWTGLWDGLVAEIEGFSGLPLELQAEQLWLARRAARTAAAASVGIFHGDLGGVNCRVDPASGAVLGLLDWDSATVGDVATDLVAIMHGVGPETAGLLRAASPRWAEAERTYRTYVATWPVQSYVWSLRSGTPDDRRAALALISAPAPAPHR